MTIGPICKPYPRKCDIEMQLIQDTSDVISLSNNGSHHYPPPLYYLIVFSFWCLLFKIKKLIIIIFICEYESQYL